MRGQLLPIGEVVAVVDAGAYVALRKGLSSSEALSETGLPDGTSILPILTEPSQGSTFIVTRDLLIAAASEPAARGFAAKVGARDVRPTQLEGHWIISIPEPSRILPAACELQALGVSVEPQLMVQAEKKPRGPR